jgi:hypothetical protein
VETKKADWELFSDLCISELATDKFSDCINPTESITSSVIYRKSNYTQNETKIHHQTQTLVKRRMQASLKLPHFALKLLKAKCTPQTYKTTKLSTQKLA